MIHSLGAKQFFPDNSNKTKEFSYYDLKAGPVPSFWQQPTANEMQNEQKGGCKNCTKKPKKAQVPAYVQMKVPRLAGKGLKTGGSLGTDGPGMMRGKVMRGWGKERAHMVGEGCGHMAEVVGKGIQQTLKNAWGKTKGAVSGVARSAVFKAVQKTGLFDNIKNQVCAEAPKHKKNLGEFVARMAQKVTSGLRLPQIIAAPIQRELTSFFKREANNLAKGLQCGAGPKWWNKIKSVAKKIRAFIEGSPVGKFVGQTTKDLYKKYVPKGIQDTISKGAHSAAGKYIMHELDQATR